MNALQSLTREDLDLLAQKATGNLYQPGELILDEGSRRQAIFVIRRGMVRVERSHLGQGISYARLGPGDIFGEMSFLENLGASASVFAEEEVEADVFEGHNVNALMVSVPGFATRFYQSLALTLAHRLRETSLMIPPLIVEDVPQVNRFHAPRTGYTRQDKIPRELGIAVKEFRRLMMRIDRELKEKEIEEPEAQRQVNEACDGINGALRRGVAQYPDQAKAVGSYVFREMFPFFMLSKRFDRAYTKPRGYAGDFQTLDLLCKGDPEGDGRLGRFIDAWFLGLPAVRAFRDRRRFIPKVLRNAGRDWKDRGPLRVTALAGGSFMELMDVLGEPGLPEVSATCVDIDAEALAAGSAVAKERGVLSRVTFFQDNVMRIGLSKGKIALPPQHVIYCLGFADYVEDRFVVRLLNWFYDRITANGLVILGSFAANNPDKPFMDHLLEWMLVHRTADQVRELFAQSRFGSRQVLVEKDETGVQLYAMCRKDG